MNRLPFLAQRLFNRPLIIDPRKAEVVIAALAGRLGIAEIEVDGLTVEAADVEMAGPMAKPASRKPYAVHDEVAIIPVEGTLVHKLGEITPFSGMTGYDGTRHLIHMALEDPEVRALWLDVDSPGGEVSGAFDLADWIHGLREIKPIWAHCSEDALSAGYLLASAAQVVSVPRTGSVGSVGVITIHQDHSKALEKAGVKATIVKAGEHKADANPYEGLSDDVLATIQADVAMVRSLFVETVARNRGLSIDDVMKTEARVYPAMATTQLPSAIDVGFADEVMSEGEAWEALQAELAG